MSIIEQAAKRMEELRRAGFGSPAASVDTVAAADAPPSLIERAAAHNALRALRPVGPGDSERGESVALAPASAIADAGANATDSPRSLSPGPTGRSARSALCAAARSMRLGAASAAATVSTDAAGEPKPARRSSSMRLAACSIMLMGAWPSDGARGVKEDQQQTRAERREERQNRGQEADQTTPLLTLARRVDHHRHGAQHGQSGHFAQRADIEERRPRLAGNESCEEARGKRTEQRQRKQHHPIRRYRLRRHPRRIDQAEIGDAGRGFHVTGDLGGFASRHQRVVCLLYTS